VSAAPSQSLSAELRELALRMNRVRERLEGARRGDEMLGDFLGLRHISLHLEATLRDAADMSARLAGRLAP